jgi:hypothetical protein
MDELDVCRKIEDMPAWHCIAGLHGIKTSRPMVKDI